MFLVMRCAAATKLYNHDAIGSWDLTGPCLDRYGSPLIIANAAIYPAFYNRDPDL